ncbi:MAG: NAD(P)/FAD-dependent oxidoreductase [Kofleriaceae bacterium]
MSKHLVIIGGGFGGLEVARRLARSDVAITLVDRRNHHLFQPLLYQVATAALNPSDIAYPIRAVLRDQQNARVLLAEARSIDVAGRRVLLDAGELRYDYLVVAAGATHSYFGQDWAAVAPGLKSIEDALEIRRRIFLAYEAAEREVDPREQRAWLTFAVVGAGPTGVELAGALGEIGLHTLARDFRSIDPTKVRVLLIEGRDRVLGAYPAKLSAAAQRSLEKRRVEVRLDSQVVSINPQCITLRRLDGTLERLEARTVLWAAGVQAAPLAASLPAPRDRSGRIEVLEDLSIPGHPEVFVIGDLARMVSAGQDVPGVAQGAIQSGRHVASILSRELRSTAERAPVRPPFRYRDKGSMATIGRSSAVVASGRYAGSGVLAYVMWWAVHIAFLVGFRSRLLVMFHWAWSWITFQRGARLITGDVGALPTVAGVAAEGEVALPASGEVVLPGPRR